LGPGNFRPERPAPIEMLISLCPGNFAWMREVVLVCPRCGARGWVEEKERGGRIYVYAVHEERTPDGRKRRRYCYLGPKGEYEYVTRLHGREGLVLKGLLEKGRVLDYLKRLIDYLDDEIEAWDEEHINAEMLKSIAEELEKTAKKLRSMAERREPGKFDWVREHKKPRQNPFRLGTSFVVQAILPGLKGKRGK